MEDGKIIISEEMLRGAATYIPLLEKQRMVEAIAPRCIAKVKLTYVPSGADESEARAAPDRHQEVKCMTSLYLMGILAHEYLHAAYDGDEPAEDYRHLQMPANVYDRWAGSHVMNQMERLKKNKEVAETIFDILYDYKELRWMLASEIETILAHNNDPVWRLMDAFGTAVNTQVAEALEPVAQAGDAAGDHPAMTREEKLETAKRALEQMDVLKERLKSLDDARSRLAQQVEEMERGEENGVSENA